MRNGWHSWRTMFHVSVSSVFVRSSLLLSYSFPLDLWLHSYFNTIYTLSIAIWLVVWCLHLKPLNWIASVEFSCKIYVYVCCEFPTNYYNSNIELWASFRSLVNVLMKDILYRISFYFFLHLFYLAIVSIFMVRNKYGNYLNYRHRLLSLYMLLWLELRSQSVTSCIYNIKKGVITLFSFSLISK